ncbi:MAG: zinc-binding dehydrogenase, partial [Gemmatimonadetes bacterium]|nr:zinc-binding dehydrogenase [Gemmatimonadota bacterium]
VSWDQGACIGIPGITAHRAVHVGGSVDGRVVLVQGAAGAVGMAAVAIAKHAGARVIATVRSDADSSIAHAAGADEVLRTDGRAPEQIVESILTLHSGGVDHVVEVAFQANLAVDEQVLKLGGSIASYATNRANPEIPFWNLVFKNARLYFLGSDDFPKEAKRDAADALSEMLAHGWAGYPIGHVLPLDQVATAHEIVEAGGRGGRVLLDPSGGAL